MNEPNSRPADGWHDDTRVEPTSLRKPRTWTVHNGEPIEVMLRPTLETVAEGTRLTTDFAPTPHGWFRVMFPVFVLVLRRQEKQNMRLIKSALERRVEMGPA